MNAGVITLNIGRRIREIRKAKGITQAYITQKLGKSTGWLNNIEKGRRNINPNELKKIADILETPIDNFFKTEPFHTT